MTQDHDTAPACQILIPSFIRNLNTIAETHGFSTRVSLETIKVYNEFDESSERPALFAEWKGHHDLLASFELISRAQRIQVAYMPDTTREFIMPSSEQWLRHPLLRGTMTREAETVSIEIDFGDPPLSIEPGEVEIIHYADETAYHGTFEALAGRGIDRARFAFGKRGVKRQKNYYHLDAEVPRWMSRRQPDGSYLYIADTELGVRRRIEAEERYHEREERRKAEWQRRREEPQRPVLRLVVDNDQRDV